VTPDDADDIWRRIQGELRHMVDPDTFDLWLEPLTVVAVDGSEVVVTAPPELRSWVADRFARVLGTCAAAVLGPGATVLVRPEEPADARLRRRPERDAATPLEETSEATLNPKYTFEQFVIGDDNRLAHAAALAVAELPAQAYNPLFIYGPPGVGKTHLLHSIGNYVRCSGGGLSVRYATAETFTSQFLAALRGDGIARFKGRYRHSDVLLIDDVQFLRHKAKTEEEFFHTFNALYDAGAQLVLTSDRLPRDLDEVEDRLRERFGAGLVTAIRAPDPATRLTVLRKRVQHDAIALADDGVLSLIAARVQTNLRALEGALIRIVAFASLTGRPVTSAVAREVLDDLYPAGGNGLDSIAPTIERIQELTAERFGITRDDLLSRSRRAQLAWPRQVAMYLAREHTSETLPAIAARFGGRNHTTVLHACRRTAARMQTDSDVRATVRDLTDRLRVAEADRRG
jgi:chromosomal replication initiator protein